MEEEDQFSNDFVKEINAYYLDALYEDTRDDLREFKENEENNMKKNHPKEPSLEMVVQQIKNENFRFEEEPEVNF